MQRRRTTLLALTGLCAGLLAVGAAAGAAAPAPAKRPLAVGTGGAVATVDPDATAVGLRVLRGGGNAADAAVAAAAALGVTEPYSAGIGGGGFFLYYDAESGEVSSIDGRETAPLAMGASAFLDPTTGAPIPLAEAVSSGLSVGTPGTPLTWQRALEEFGTISLAEALQGATRLARQGFVVDETFRAQTQANEARFRRFPATAELFLPGGALPEVGSVFRNPDLARTYRLMAREGVAPFYTGRIAREIVRTARDPQETGPAVRNGLLREIDLAAYEAPLREPTRVEYRGLDVYGMAPPSSGGTTVGEALNILEQYRLSSLPDEQVLHTYLEAGALAFADRAKYVGDPRYVQVPLRTLLSDKYAAERACNISPTQAAPKPVAAGDASAYDGVCPTTAARGTVEDDTENISTTNLTVADKWGNVAEYTLTIEQTGGSGMVVPRHGFLLNNELTDFSTVYSETDPNRIQPGKRPRSSMSPTIVLKDGKPFMALGSPGGSTIITTVLQMIVNRIDLGMSIEQAIAAPRTSPRNTASVTSEPEFIAAYGPALTARGHKLVSAGDAFTSASQIGAATAIEFGPDGTLTAVSEPVRRGGGSARVVDPR